MNFALQSQLLDDALKDAECKANKQFVQFEKSYPQLPVEDPEMLQDDPWLSEKSSTVTLLKPMKVTFIP